MILVEEAPMDNPPSNLEDAILPDLERQDYVFPHGLTPPMQHARARRFRKRTPKHEIETIEEQVKHLLERDEAAVDVKWEVVDENDNDEEEPHTIDADGNESDGSLAARIDEQFQDTLSTTLPMPHRNAALEAEIESKRQEIALAPNPIVKMKLQEALDRLLDKHLLSHDESRDESLDPSHDVTHSVTHDVTLQ